jgi:hypothetical protein
MDEPRAITITDPDTVAAIERVAKASGRRPEDVVRDAVTAVPQPVRPRLPIADPETLRVESARIRDAISALVERHRIPGAKPLTDDEMYDEFGLPI